MQKVIDAAPEDADYVAHEGFGNWQIADRQSGLVIASANLTGFQLIARGISENKKSLWAHASRTFICGTVEQLTRHEQEQEA
jgi:hypothetical protein